MNLLISRLLHSATALANTEPVITLFLGAALLAVFYGALQRPARSSSNTQTGLMWLLYQHLGHLICAVSLVILLLSTIGVLRTYLRQTANDFQRTHGRITQANYDAVQTIWGAEQVQNELNVDVYHNEDTVERIESEDPTKPALLRPKTVHKSVSGNPFVSARHAIILRQNPRKKGSAYYGGYETDCSFDWQLRNPSDTNQQCILTFPLPAEGAMYDALAATIDGADVLPSVAIKDSSLVLERQLGPSQQINFHIGFKSRGLSYWYFQVRESREIRDFTLTLTLTDLPKAKLNYPDGCMTPTTVEATADNSGSILTYRLDHALTQKGMGISLPKLPQPGETTRAVLSQTEDAWLLVVALLLLGFTLNGNAHGVLYAVMFSAATAFGYGLVADFSDLLFGFWGTAIFVLLPLFVLLAWLLWRVARKVGSPFPALYLSYSVIYPCLAGLDEDRGSLYFDLCAFGLLIFSTWLLTKNLRTERTSTVTAASPA